ncbi:hypothetical protein ACFCXK_31880 [Streptomyces sp. NPDC056269]|uniref:hypothetical protein n=1 Tax=Streptomyces sp. NPDC056269 TaxID=3345768 RepID=UPI0035DAFD18
MLTDLITGSLAELLGGLAVILLLAVAERARRQRQAVRRSAAANPESPGVTRARTYTLPGTLAPDGHPIRIVSTRPAGTLIYHRGLFGREDFELTDAMLSDGTYAAEPLSRYR